MSQNVVPSQVVQATIDSFSRLDSSGDQKSMNKLAKRLGKEQPALLQYAAARRAEHGDKVGEAAVFYGTLVWAIFDRASGKPLPRLTPDNLTQAEEIVKGELAGVDGVAEKPIHERTAPGLLTRQPDVCAKLRELIEEDVREAAMTAECAEVVYPTAQLIVEAFDAALDGRRPGERQGPITRDEPKVGRNDACPCGSGKKYKKCHGAAA